MGLKKSGFATRANLHATAQITLSDARDSKTLLSGSHTIIGSYDILDSEYATLMAEKNAEARAVAELALAIRNQLSVYFLQTTTNPTGQAQ